MGASILETPRMTARWQNKLNNSLADSPVAYDQDQAIASSSSTPVDSPKSLTSSTTTADSPSASENSGKRIMPSTQDDVVFDEGLLTSRMARIRAVFSFKNPSENVFFWLPFVTLLREGAEVSFALYFTTGNDVYVWIITRRRPPLYTTRRIRRNRNRCIRRNTYLQVRTWAFNSFILHQYYPTTLLYGCWTCRDGRWAIRDLELEPTHPCT
jgi:hypothetical protein